MAVNSRLHAQDTDRVVHSPGDRPRAIFSLYSRKKVCLPEPSQSLRLAVASGRGPGRRRLSAVVRRSGRRSIRRGGTDDQGPQGLRRSQGRRRGLRENAVRASGDVMPLPVELFPIDTAIERSRCILDLLDDWDDEGAPAISKATWDRAIDWLRGNALSLWTDHHIITVAPVMSAGPDGSVDVHWKDDRRQLLVNVPADASQRMEFFGDDRGDTVVKGILDQSVSNLWLFDWLMK